MPSPSTHFIQLEFFKELYECVVNVSNIGTRSSSNGSSRRNRRIGSSGRSSFLSDTCLALINQHPDLLLDEEKSKCPPGGFQILEKRFVKGGFTYLEKPVTKWCGLRPTECICDEIASNVQYQRQDPNKPIAAGTFAALTVVPMLIDILIELIELGATVTDECYNLAAFSSYSFSFSTNYNYYNHSFNSCTTCTNLRVVEALLLGGYVPTMTTMKMKTHDKNNKNNKKKFFLDLMVENVDGGQWDVDDEDELEQLAAGDPSLLGGILKILNKQIKVGDEMMNLKNLNSYSHPTTSTSSSSSSSSGSSGGGLRRTYGPTVVHNVMTKLPKLRPASTTTNSGCVDGDYDTTYYVNDNNSNDTFTHSRDGPFAAVQETWLRLNGLSTSQSSPSSSPPSSSKLNLDDDDDDDVEVGELRAGRRRKRRRRGGEEKHDDHSEYEYDDDDDDSDENDDLEDEVEEGDHEEEEEEDIIDDGDDWCMTRTNSDEDDDHIDYDGKKKQKKKVAVRNDNRGGRNDRVGTGMSGRKTGTSGNKRKRNIGEEEEEHEDEKHEVRMGNSHDNDKEKKNELPAHSQTGSGGFNGGGGHIIQNGTTMATGNDDTTNDGSASTNTDFYGTGGFFPAGCAVYFPKNKHWNSAILACDVLKSDVTASVKHNNGTVETLTRRNIEIVPINSGRPTRRRGR